MIQKISLKLVILIVFETVILPNNFCKAGKQANPGSENRLIWFNTPANSWQEEALPIGNGSLGAMIFGGVAKERIQFNEDSQWVGDETDVGAYQAFGDLYFEFGQTSKTYSDYKRSLNLRDGVQRISYQLDGVKYRRKYFASYPAGMMVFHFTADQEGAYSGNIQLTDSHEGTVTAQGNRITSSGSLPGPGANGHEVTFWIRGDYDISLDYEAQVLVLNNGGTLEAGTNGSISFRDCNSLTVLLAAGTDYLNKRSSSWKGEHPHSRLSSALEDASKKSFKV
ncbi:glycoside hydrolase family 95 protein, partial [bacterium]|nr:glycoside hydrolase family 95 protein [bacterium]